MEEISSFSTGVDKELKSYVYRLIDPRDGQTFYVGRGQGNRVFDHVNDELKLDEEETVESVKLETIRRIRRVGLRPTHIIHRHGMTPSEAREVESALIDMIPGLSNIAPGAGVKRGPANARQLDDQYLAKPLIEDPAHKLMYIKIQQRTVDSKGLYEAVRRSWGVDRSVANQADYVLAVVKKVVAGVFTDCNWDKSKEEIPSAKGKSEFIGREVFDDDLIDKYVGKEIPLKYRKGGMAGSWYYSWTRT